MFPLSRYTALYKLLGPADTGLQVGETNDREPHAQMT